MKSLKLLSAVLYLGSAAHASIITYYATLNGANEVPATGSPGTGFALVTVDNVLNTMSVYVTFSGLVGPSTASHIHCCVAPGGNAGVATTTPTFPGFPLGVTSGTYNNLFDLTQASTYNPAFVTSEGGTVAQAEAALLAGMAAGLTYLNIHSSVDPGGEIRGFLTPTPEAGTFFLAGLALAGLAIGRRRFGLRQ
jgi:hypothetical protein